MRSDLRGRKNCSVVFASASIGCGHTRAAVAIQDALADHLGPNFATFLDAMEDSPTWFKHIYRGGYLAAVRFFPRVVGRLYARSDSTPIRSTRASRFAGRIEDQALLRLCNRPELHSADIVVSTHFLTSGVLARMRQRGELQAPLVTVVTDEHPHATWLHRGSDLTCVASESARMTAIAAGLSPDAVCATGIPVDPRLGRLPQTILRDAFETRQQKPTILICGGGHGLGALFQVVQSVIAASLHATVIVVCGKNESLRREIESLSRAKSDCTDLRVIGYSNQMHTLMSSADLLVGKPGGLTTTEARAIGLPMLLLQPIPGQEEHNAEMLVRCGAAVRLRNPKTAAMEINAILADPQILWRMRAASAAAGQPHAATDIATRILGKVRQAIPSHRHARLDQRIMH